MIVLVRPSQARLRRDVENDVTAFRRCRNGRRIRHVTTHVLDAEFAQGRMFLPRQTPHHVAARAQRPHNRETEETTTACDERVHRSCFSAHTASFSRKIFALCRMSTGNAGWKSTVRMDCV